MILTGGAGNDLLAGGTGSDLLVGGAGNDTLAGNTGNDLFIYTRGEGCDQLTDAGGVDTVEFGKDISIADLDAERVGSDLILGLRNWATDNGTVSSLAERIVLKNWATAANRIEQVRFANGLMEDTSGWKIGTTANDTLSGDVASDRLFGGAGNDSLDGGIGADRMIGGLGNDTYVVDDESDVVLEVGNSGTDTVRSTITFTLGANLENLLLQGSYEIDGTGNALDNSLTGNTASNKLFGLDGTDRLDGGAGADEMVGGRGDDTYIVDDAGDALTEQAGEGTDTVCASLSFTLAENFENLTLTGTSAINGTGNEADNLLIGNAATNTLTGGAGNDVLNGGAGADLLIGGDGDDCYSVDATGDAITEFEDEGVDSVQSSVTLILGANVENLTLTGTAAINGTGNELDNALIGNEAVNTLTGGAGNDRLDGGSEIDVLAGGAGDDTYVVGYFTRSTTTTATTTTYDEYGNPVTATTTTVITTSAFDSVSEAADGGNDTVETALTYTLGANLENLTLTGTAAVNGTGNTLANVLAGNGAANRLDGGSGADAMSGGAGNDTFVVDNAGDAVTEHAAEGIDLVQSGVTFALPDNVENLTLTGAAAINGTGNALDNAMIGNSAANTLAGGDGNDTLDGGAGADALIGGAGNDTYMVDAAGDEVTEAAGEGTDTVLSSVAYTLAATIENLTLTGTAAIVGTGNDLDNVLIGNTAANTLIGGAGNDSLNGGAGSDSMIGGAGDDTYTVDAAGDVITEAAGEGTDLVLSSVTYTLAVTVENLTLTGTAAVSGTGNALDNILVGNGANNGLMGGAGNDILDGGTGSDTMAGGAGDDVFYANATTDVVTELANEGVDTVYASASYTLSANVENLVLIGAAVINGTGNTQNNVLSGNNSDNTLNGAAGADTLAGNCGNDIYVVDNTGDTVLENAGEGTDLVQASISYTLVANVENLTLTGTTAINGTGNELDNQLTGNSAINTLLGGLGNDVINGGAGADILAGGAGNDIYVVDSAGDAINEMADDGADTVTSSVTYTLAANVENLTLIGTGAISGTGNELDNVIVGNAAINTLTGGAGNDRLDGGAEIDILAGGLGDDTYIVSFYTRYTTTTSYVYDEYGNVVSTTTTTTVAASGYDTVNEAAGSGNDTVEVAATYTLGANIENLTLTGTAAIDGTGNALNNLLRGNDAANVLNGGAGADSLLGGGGNDIYVIDDTGDSVEELSGGGIDLVQSALTYTLGENVENLTLIGSAAINGFGNNLDNRITGNSAANILNGNAGNDTLNGAVGADAMTGGEGNDIYVVDNLGDLVTENALEGTDLVQAGVTYTLTTNVENLSLTGTAAVDGSGNGLGNQIVGNSAANKLYGLGGNDVIDGGAGADTMTGGIDNDRYYVDAAGDTVVELAGEGMDTVLSSVTCTLAANVENLTLTGKSTISGNGNELENFITGNSANNALSGFAGADILNGGAGADLLKGGSGNDTYYVDMTADAIVENAAEGIDAVFSSANYVLTANVENLTLTGISSINATGNELGNHLVGNGARNTLNGKAGADLMEGGQGGDTYVVDDVGDVVTELANEGIDALQASIDYSLENVHNVENLTLLGTVANGTGNELDNTILGNASANLLKGLAGDDYLDGQKGADTMVGGTGNDVFLVDIAGDTVVELANEGTDTVISNIDYMLGECLENLTLSAKAINGTGNALDNTLIGNSMANILVGGAGNDLIDGGTGNDSLTGGAGDDTYYVNSAADVIFEEVDSGVDQVFSTATYRLTANLEKLILTGKAAINGTGNNLANTLVGNVANNMLDGGIGADDMTGGKGNDIYIVDNIDDKAFELIGEGVDSVQASIDWMLGQNIENLTLTGTLAVNGTGNSLDNVLIGNVSDNILNGGAGIDALSGGKGNDIYYVDAAKDAVTELAGAGVDEVRSSVSYVLSANIEKLSLLADTAALNGTGNALNNIITGNGCANRLDGGAGADSMAGGLGDDTYVVDNASDVITEREGEGTDTVESFITVTLRDNLDKLVLKGTAAISGTGNALDNSLMGNNANNLLSGGNGNDVFYGGGGRDTFIGGAGNDTFVIDRVAVLTASISDFMQGADTIALGRASYAGLFEGAALKAGVFANGTAATSADQRLFYNAATGGLFYDSDGNGSKAAVQVATLASKPAALSASDFTLALGG